MLTLALLWTLTASAAEPTLPSLAEGAEPDWPADVLQAGEEGAVELLLQVDASGYVVDAEVQSSTHPELEAPALLAALDLVFTPGLNAKGQPEAATLLYRFTVSQAAPEPEAEGPESIRGQVIAKGAESAVTGAVLELTGPAGETEAVQPDQDGLFSVRGLSPGTWELSLTAPGFNTLTTRTEVREGQISEIILRPVLSRPWEQETTNEIVVTGTRVEPEITERVLQAEQIKVLPGTNGDVVRVIQNLPGVARPPLNIGQLIIRGTLPEDSRYTLDGMRVPAVFHFAGLSTVISSNSVSEVAFLPGNYGVRYGRAIGGQVDLRTKSAVVTERSSALSVDIYQASAYTAVPLSERTSLMVSGRRSYIDTVLTPILKAATGAGTQAPRYWDGQVQLVHEHETQGTFDFMWLSTSDQFRIVGGDSEEVAIGLTNNWHRGRFRWTKELAGGWRHEMGFIAGPQSQGFQIQPDGEAYEKPWSVGFRDEFYRGATEDRLGWRVGIDLERERFRFLYDIPTFGVSEEANVYTFYPAAYAEVTLVEGAFTYTPGVRVDGLISDTGATSVQTDPRFSMYWDAPNGSTRVKAAAGQYSQWPTARQLDATGQGNPYLTATRSLQTTVGVEQTLTPQLQLEVSPFYNRLRDQVVGREDSFAFFSGPPNFDQVDTKPYANEGVGRIYGIESLLRFENERAIGWISATLQRSTRTKREGNDPELFRYDQPLVLNALGSYALPKQWRVGARVRYGSGNPYTPVVNRIYDLDRRTYSPVFGETDSARLPSFFSLDLRLDKTYVLRRWTLNAYLDIQNVTNNQNPEVMNWSFDYSEETPITSLPTLPTFGLEAKW